MLSQLLIALLSAQALVSAHPATLDLPAAGPPYQNVSHSHVCGTAEPSDALKQAHEILRTSKSNTTGLQTRGLAVTGGPLVVDTWMHFVTTVDQAPYFPSKTRAIVAANQAAVLNQAYRSANITFHVKGTTYVIRNDWATDANSTKMKQSLRKGTYNTLNIYFQTNLSSNAGTPGAQTLLGYCTLPTTITYGNPPVEYPAADYATDGCNVLAGTMPEVPHSVYGYNLGKTAVHEVGHWFGLLHTFQDTTCNPLDSGDYIDDTPQEAESTSGCPVGKDTCPGRPGVDPIMNYMDYSTDVCYTQFTPDQQMRMQNMFGMFRKGR